MKYRDLHIETQRQPPNNARTEGFSLLVHAGYLTRENVPTKLGEYTLDHLQKLSSSQPLASALLSFESLRATLSLSTISNENETFFPIPSVPSKLRIAPSCKYTERLEFARFKKTPLPQEEQLPLEKVSTPDCNTIEVIGEFSQYPKGEDSQSFDVSRASLITNSSSSLCAEICSSAMQN